MEDDDCESEGDPRNKDDAIKFTPSFICSIGGIIIKSNLVLLLTASIIMACYKNIDYGNRRMDFFLFTTIYPIIFWTIAYMFYLFNLTGRMKFINWPITFLINAAVHAVLLFIASSLIADQGIKLKHATAYAAAAFGFLAMVGLAIQSFFHVRDRK